MNERSKGQERSERVKPRSHYHDCGHDCPRLTVDGFLRASREYKAPEFNFPMNAYDYSAITPQMSTNSVRCGSRFVMVLTRCVTINYDYCTI